MDDPDAAREGELRTFMDRYSALVTARWVFRRPDETVVWDFVDSYNLCRLDGHWKFLVRTLHD